MVSVLLRFLSTLSPCKAINNRDRTGCEKISFGSAMMILSTPCLAVVEPDGLCSIENTLWEAPGVFLYIGFCGGDFYINLGLFSFFFFEGAASDSSTLCAGIIMPYLNFGTMFMVSDKKPFFLTLLLFKASDNWTPTSYDGEAKLQDSELMTYEFTEEQKEWHDIFSDLI